jgi:hypothetical protein
MDQKDIELYQEEQRALLLDLTAAIQAQTTAITDQSLIVAKLLEDYVAPKEKVSVSGVVEVNTEKEVAVTNLDDHTEQIVSAVKDIKPTTEVTVKNIEAAQSPNVEVTNLKGLEEGMSDLSKDVVNLQTALEEKDMSVNVTKEKITMPSTARDYVSVRLTDGKRFYEAMTTVASSLSNLPLVQSTVTGEWALSVANADGTPVTGGTSTADT